MTDWKELSEVIFPHVKDTIISLEKKYPHRKENVVTRFAPSPT